ncbi:MAG: ThiF family adenylyltransferase [Armatimonadetes bacterium]|nr:ThiF family adenylyltransferase [Armatimonadota bacterium]MDE2205792.1 ThiF family adenylyltransferase [Armatimonadota bacterium]
MPERTDLYHRQRRIPGWRQARLAGARVLVAGAGATGNEVLRLLARSGVGHIAVVDFDQVERSNLSRTSLFDECDVGANKAKAAVAALLKIHPELLATAFAGRLQTSVGAGTLRAMDIAVGCLDSVEARLALNRMCRAAGTPWVDVGIEADAAAVTLFGGRSGACYECEMTEEMWQARSRRHSCTGAPVRAADAPAGVSITMAALAGAIAAHEVLWMLMTPRAKQAARCGRRIMVSANGWHMDTTKPAQNPQCNAHELAAPIAATPPGAQEWTTAELLTFFGCPDGSVELPHDALMGWRCTECGYLRTEIGALEAIRPSRLKCRCGSRQLQLDVSSTIESGEPEADIALHRLGVPEGGLLRLRCGRRRFYAELGGPFQFGTEG